MNVELRSKNILTICADPREQTPCSVPEDSKGRAWEVAAAMWAVAASAWDFKPL